MRRLRSWTDRIRGAAPRGQGLLHFSIQTSTLISVVIGQTIILATLASMILVANDRAEQADTRTNLAVTCVLADLAEHRSVNFLSHQAEAEAHGFALGVPPGAEPLSVEEAIRLKAQLADACRTFAWTEALRPTSSQGKGQQGG